MAQETEANARIESSDKQDCVNIEKAKSIEGLGSHLNVSVSMKCKTDSHMTQSFELVQKCEALIKSKVVRSVNPETGNMNLNLGDFMRSTICLEHVCIQVDDGVFSMEIKCTNRKKNLYM